MSHDRPISIHALREEGDLFSQVCKDGIVISIHALREEGDGTSWSWRTLPCISIHALREEGDDNDVDKFIASFDFYPRPPRGGRPEGVTREYFVHIISIHALREEGDMRTVYRVQTAQTFLSTPSARRATESNRSSRG